MKGKFSFEKWKRNKEYLGCTNGTKNIFQGLKRHGASKAFESSRQEKKFIYSKIGESAPHHHSYYERFSALWMPAVIKDLLTEFGTEN